MRIGLILIVAACSFRETPVPNNDAPTPTPNARKAADIVAGGGRVKAGAVTLDVEIGRAVPVTTVHAGVVTIRSATAVQP